MRVAGFPTAAAAAERYDKAMRCPFVSTPKHPGEVQTVASQRAGGGERAPRQAAAPVPAAAPAKKGAPFRRYAGVSESRSNRFMAFSKTTQKNMVYLGYYDTAKEAADVHDAHVRLNTPAGVAPVVNTPLHAGEIQAVPREHESMTRQRAAGTGARTKPQPLRAQRSAAGLPAPADALATKPKKRKASDAPPADADAGAGGFASDGAAAAPAAPEPKRASILQSPPAPLPPTPQQAPALPLAAPAPAAAVVVAAGGSDDDDLVAFLRGISPPLADIDRVAATAAGSGVQMSQLLEAVRAPPHEGATMLNLAADVVGIRRGADKLTLMKALWALA